MASISDSIKRLNMFFGLLIGVDEASRMSAASENFAEYILELLGDEPVMLSPPSISNLSGTDVDFGAFFGISNGMPLFQNTPQTVSFNVANAGSVLGNTSVLAGRARWVAVMARSAEVGQIDAVDLNEFPVKKEYHHAVEYRVIMSNDFPVGAPTGEPADYQLEIDGGSAPILVIFREAATETLYPVYRQRKLIDSLARHLRISGELTEGSFLSNAADVEAIVPNFVIVDEGGPGPYQIQLDGADDWVAQVAGQLLDSKVLEGEGNDLKSENDVPVGTSLLRLQVTEDWPDRPRLYLADGTNYPSADGEDYDPIPATLLGDTTNPGAFPSTVKDVVLAKVVSGTPPTVTPITAPPRNISFVEDVAADYSVGLSAADAALEVTVTLPANVGRLWDVVCLFDSFDPGASAPPGRGVPHQMFCRIKYQTFETIVLELRGSWLDTSAALAVPGSNRYFRPAARLFISSQEPVSIA